MKTNKITTLLLLLLTALFLTGCGKTRIVLTTGFEADEIFRISDEKCYDKEAYVYLANMESQYTTVYGQEIWSVSAGSASLKDAVRDSVLGRLARVKMMAALAESYNLSLDKDEKEKAKSAAQEYTDSLSPEEKKNMGGLKASDVQKMYQEYAMARKIYDYLTEEINSEISDDEARTIVVKCVAFLFTTKDENGNAREMNETEKAGLLDKANEVYDKVLSGTEFEELVIQYSDLPDETCYYRKGEMEEALENQVFMLGEGEVSQILTGSDGYYIYCCINPNDTAGTEETKAEILEDRRKQAFETVYSSFIKDKKCYLNEDVWNEISYERSPGSKALDFFEIYEKYFG